MNHTAESTTGRFAPTPSGPLHFGSLVTAVASYCHARSADGRWLLRIEDLDTPRIIKGSATDILITLETFGFEWDGEVLYQSQRFANYEETLQDLMNKKIIYACSCSRKSLLNSRPESGPLGIIYPGFCRNKQLDYQSFNLRLNIDSTGLIEFYDSHYGACQLNLSRDVGDIVLKRNDGVYAYHLAVVIDDAFQQVNEIVRGADLLPVTGIHLYLNKLLGLPSAKYLHIPVIKNNKGEKLSKQTGAKGIDRNNASKQLVSALQYLGQDTPMDLTVARPREILQYAISHWDSRRIPEHP